MTDIVYIPKYNLITVSIDYWGIRIYNNDMKGNSIRIFQKHKGRHRNLIHLTDDITASVDQCGTLMTWRALRGVVLDELKVYEEGI